MRKIIGAILFCCLITPVLYAQEKTEAFQIQLLKTIRLTEIPEISFSIQAVQHQTPHFRQVDAVKPIYAPKQEMVFRKSQAAEPHVLKAFEAQTPSGTPLDNSIAISREGKILNAVNTTIRIYDTLGNILLGRSLAAIGNSLGTLNRTFDPHTMYDPLHDRFILMFLNGSDHTNTNIILGFSKTSDPAGDWNFYKVPGNTTNQEWWSDYPFMGLNARELFISVLLWNDGESGWETDAVNENIWQISLKDGYEGKTLRTRQFSDLQYSGKQLWNTRPVTGGDRLYDGDFYFLGNRPKDLQNDTVFLIRISGSLDDASQNIQVSAFRSSLPYGLQPNVTQLGGRRLRTNYCDIQHAYRLEDNLYFVANSIDFLSGKPAVYLGKVQGINQPQPQITGQLLTAGNLDLNYPAIAYAGAGWPDESAMVLALHSSPDTFPGCGVFYVGREFSSSSDYLILKKGQGAMNILLSDTLERWGDYTGIHTRFGHPGEVWVAGSFGRTNGGSQTWVAGLRNQDPLLGLPPAYVQEKVRIYPNPGYQFSIEMEGNEGELYRIELINGQGKTLHEGNHVASMNSVYRLRLYTETAPPGVYFLRISHKDRVIKQEKLVVTY